MRRWLLGLAAAAGITGAQAQGTQHDTILLDGANRGVEVRARARPAAPGTSRLAITVRTVAGAQAFPFEVLQHGDAAEALAAQKARTGWKDDYLFVRDDCLAPADAKRPWRCVLERVYTLVETGEGKTRRLIYVGEVHAGDDCAEEAKFGCSLYENLFTDVYDKFEINALAPPEESPALLLEMRVRNGEFIVDLDETWGRNQERFNAGVRCLLVPPAGRAAACIDGITPRRAYLFNAVLATYTKRTDQLMRVHAYARDALCDGISDDGCGEKLRLSALMLASIRPGERPRGGANITTAPSRSP